MYKKPGTISKILIIVLLFNFLSLNTLYAGSITAPGGSPSATSYTLTDIFNRIKTNAVATLGNHSLSPTTTPQSSYHSLTEIYNALPTIYASDFLASSTYLGITGSIDVKTGDTAVATGSVSATTLLLQPPIGYYNGNVTVSTTSTNFIASNIKNGVFLFGIVGSYGGGGGGSAANKTPLKTGQTLCYDSGGSPVSCVGTGQDGETTNGTARSYTDNGNSTISDNATGLMWEKCNYGLSGASCATGSATKVAWSTATSTCETAVTGGHSDWKLPNINELATLIDYAPADPDPSINATYFPNTKSDDYTWSSTQDIYARPGAWTITFYDGQQSTDPVTATNYIRCVRVEASPASSAAAQPLATGQTLCFNDEPFPTGKGFETPCAPTGQDGYYQAGTAHSYTNNNDGTISDNATGLMWQRCAYGNIGTYCDNFDPNDTGPATFSDAVNICSSATTGGYTDWRLPNINELRSLIDYHRFVYTSNDKIGLDPIYFPSAGGNYISSTLNASYAAFGAFFWGGVVSYGAVSASSDYSEILCVR